MAELKKGSSKMPWALPRAFGISSLFRFSLIIAISVLSVTALSLTGCLNPYTEQGEMATVTINLGGGTARSTGFGGVPLNSISHSVRLIDLDTFPPESTNIPVSSSGTASINVKPGNYSIEVDASLRGWPFATGSSANFSIAAGDKEDVEIFMHRIPNAIVLDIQKGDAISYDFPLGTAGAPPPPLTITISNFTGTNPGGVPTGTPATITATITGVGFNTSPSPVNITIPSDEPATLQINTSATPLGRNNAMLNIIANGTTAIASINLSSLVATRIIYDQTDLETMPVTAGYNVLANNITLDNTFAPIGGDAAVDRFQGTFDGNGHTISGFNIDTSSNYQGLFAYIGVSGRVINLGVRGGSITGGQYVGGIAGYNTGGGENCYSEVNVSGSAYVGGIAGENSNTTSASFVRNCYATGNVSASTWFVGGIAGRIANQGIAENNVALNPSISRTVTNTNQQFGRIAGAIVNSSNNHANSDMQFFSGGSPQAEFPNPAQNPTGKDGEDFTSSFTAWNNIPTWDVHANKADAGPSSPWWWDASVNRPRLWNE